MTVIGTAPENAIGIETATEIVIGTEIGNVIEIVTETVTGIERGTETEVGTAIEKGIGPEIAHHAGTVATAARVGAVSSGIDPMTKSSGSRPRTD